MSKQDCIKDFMTTHTHTVGLATPIDEAEAMMDEYRVRHLPVLHGGSLVGIISDRDIAAARQYNDDPGKLPVEEACTQEVYTVGPDASLKECVSHMAERHLGCTIIAQNNRVLGIFTTTDACRVLAARL